MWVRRIKASASTSETLCARERDREKERERERERASERARERENERERGKKNRDKERERERDREGGREIKNVLERMSAELQKTKQGASPVCAAPS